MSAARRTPLIAAVPKMLFPFLVILPGMIALVTGSHLRPTAPPGSATPAAVAQAAESGPCMIPPKLDANDKPVRDNQGRPELDYNMATPSMLLHFFPAGLLGLGLAALLASFMSGMAGNVTAFNTVWTYDIYHSYLNRRATDQHLLWMGRLATIFGIALSVAAAYAATQFNNIMDVLQLVFAFVNAPLFATFALGMFWRRTTGHGAFFGLLAGTLAAAIHHGLTLPAGALWGLKGGYLGVWTVYPSELGQTFWTAIWAFTVCIVVTAAVSLATEPRPAGELRGLVYSLTPKPEETERAWYKRPGTLAIVVLLLTIALNIYFF
jgi:SSS family solute:Na+ symporter